ncbi:hypothetical protein GOP47_0026087 [Adiantum capillus-veneris]|uniref:ZF-HD dimerization-type domain-containing protein n=1 Tax=Adiantum capillus-veneris TaxID=13818 RepID=A0A9D4Z2M4_ADICA|nr:hypothetical protein GOP47_0026087 [Adiantum capillus-veneris]
MDGHNMLLDFSSSQFTEPDAIRFLHEVSMAQLKSQVVNDSSDSRDGMPPTHHIIANAGHFWTPDEINNVADDNLKGENNQIDMEKPMHTRYRECMKNHAAALGRHSVDGCGDFIPSGSEGLDAFKCAACSCHRNFHRKEIQGSVEGCMACGKDLKRPPTPAQLVIAHAPTSTGDGNMLPLNHAVLHKKKRHRTIFTLEQKEKMFYFAESLGWKILKHDEECVQSFCDDVGVSRRIFRVWMHNHKHTMKRK